jgi:hypothetical protein
MTNKDWILEIYDNRDTLAHSASPFIGFGDNDQPSFEKRNPADGSLAHKKEFENLLQYLRGTVSNIYGFLDAYITHFRTRVPESDVTEMLTSKL